MGGSLMPAPGPDPYTYPGHSGVDFLRGPSWRGKPFYASAPGVVLRTPYNVRGGWWTTIQYDRGVTVGYAHQDRQPPVRAGQRVSEGSLIGYVGATGTNVTGPHVHVEIIGVSTDAAVWRFFDRNRIVGGGVPAGSVEEDMTPEERKMLQQIHHRVHKGLTGPRIARSVWAEAGMGAKVKRMANRVLALYDSVRYGKKGVRTHGALTDELLTRNGRQELQNEALLAAMKTLADSQGVDGEAIVQQVAKSVDKALADVSITLSTEPEE